MANPPNIERALAWAMAPLPRMLQPLTQDQRVTMERRWRAPTRASRPQRPCDHGLFSDQAAQSDLVDVIERQPAAGPCDLQFANLQSFASCTPLTGAGEAWLLEHVDDEALLMGGALLIEFRYLEEFVLAARAAGLLCEG